jgi:hypothetical protein
MPIPITQWCDGDGAPLAYGMLEFFIVGTSTPKAVYSTADGTVSLGTNVILDADGRAPAIFLALDGYKVVLSDADSNVIWTQDQVETVGETAFGTLGVQLATGARDVTSTYAILDDDVFVTVDGTGGANPCLITLPVAGTRGQPVTIKNVGNVPLSLLPQGSDTIEGEAWPSLSVPAAATPFFPTVTLLSDGTGWWILSTASLETS